MPWVFCRRVVEAREYGILVPGLATVRAPELKGPIANLAGERSRIVDALDYLFLGI